MKVVFIHQNFPAQYRHLAPALHARGDAVQSIGGPTSSPLPAIPHHRYAAASAAAIPVCHGWAADLHTKCLRAEAVALALDTIRGEGFRPDLVIGHPAWGELLAVKDIAPEVPVLHQVEYVYQLEGGDVGFDPEFGLPDWRERTRVRLRRAIQLSSLHDMDWGVAPTHWQASTVPASLRHRVSVIHEGIDTHRIAPRSTAEVRLKKAGLRFRAGDELVSFVVRQLEPYRGFHRFMRMLPELQQLRPQAHVVIVGGDGVSYGKPPPAGGTWREVLLKELEGRLDLERIHFVGHVSHHLLHELFRVCACHVYLTVPFVLSWSLLEAMACEALVIGSATPPVQEVIEHGRNGLLVDFFDVEGLAGTIAAVLENPQRYLPLARAARATVVDRYDLHQVSLPRQLALVDTLAAGRMPSPDCL